MKKYFVGVLFSIFHLTISAQDKQNVVQPQVRRIVNKLKKENVVHLGNPIGLSTIPDTSNLYYKLYKKLGQIATDDELITLTDNTSPVIVVYAFSLLHLHNYTGLKSIFLSHLKDTSNFRMTGGCEGVNDRVNSFMFWKISPPYSEDGIFYFTEEESAKYSKLVEQ